MPAKEDFTGFPDGTLKFLRGLRKNNTKTWFDAHRSDYDNFYVAPAKSFVEAIGVRLKRIAPAIVAEPIINGSIFRINRNVRFSNDKRPYKDHLDFSFWEGEKKGSSSALFFRVSPMAFTSAPVIIPASICSTLFVTRLLTRRPAKNWRR